MLDSAGKDEEFAVGGDRFAQFEGGVMLDMESCAGCAD